MLVLRNVAVAALLVSSAHVSRAETVPVLGRGPVDLTHLVCESVMQNITRGAMRRVCYDETNRYLVIQLGSLYLHYCEVEPHRVDALLHSEAVGPHFSANFAGRYDCRTRYLPRYE